MESSVHIVLRTRTEEVNALTTPNLSNKAEKMIAEVYRDLGGTGSPNDIDEFKKIVNQAPPQKVESALHDTVQQNLIRPLMTDGGEALPTNVVDQVSILFEATHKAFTESAVGSGTRGG